MRDKFNKFIYNKLYIFNEIIIIQTQVFVPKTFVDLSQRLRLCDKSHYSIYILFLQSQVTHRIET